MLKGRKEEGIMTLEIRRSALVFVGAEGTGGGLVVSKFSRQLVVARTWFLPPSFEFIDESLFLGVADDPSHGLASETDSSWVVDRGTWSLGCFSLSVLLSW